MRLKKCGQEVKTNFLKISNLMTEEQYDEFLDSLNEEELDEIIRSFVEVSRKLRKIGKRCNRKIDDMRKSSHEKAQRKLEK